MKKALPAMLILFLATAPVSAQDLNKIVFGPLDGDEAGVLTVLNEEEIEIEMWVRTDPDNPAEIMGTAHGILSADSIIASRDGFEMNPYYDEPYWENTSYGPYFHNPDDEFPVPEDHTSENLVSIHNEGYDHWLDTDGEWDYFGSFLMTCNTGVPVDNTYFPFSRGWWPHGNQSTNWTFRAPPGGSVVPEQDYCGLHFVPECIYIVGDCNHNGAPWELPDVIAMIGFYRGTVPTPYMCYCPPHDDDYAPGADPNADCVPFELSDVVFMIRPPHWPPFGCPDCPGYERLVIGESENQ